MYEGHLHPIPHTPEWTRYPEGNDVVVLGHEVDVCWCLLAEVVVRPTVEQLPFGFRYEGGAR